ncbi:hypothetical protein SUDANB95_02775 [Actinosynnema sp. ALI-1.44]
MTAAAVAVGLAMLVMAAFAAIPRRARHLRLPAVLGWALVWLDGRLTGHVGDLLGLLVTATSLAFLVKLGVERRRRRVTDQLSARRS